MASDARRLVRRPAGATATVELAPGAERLALPHFAHLRAVSQGMPAAEAAPRYLAVEDGREALAAHRRLVDRAAAIARRRGDSRWRLLCIEIAASAPSATGP
jgi:hypothetical protein